MTDAGREVFTKKELEDLDKIRKYIKENEEDIKKKYGYSFF